MKICSLSSQNNQTPDQTPGDEAGDHNQADKQPGSGCSLVGLAENPRTQLGYLYIPWSD